MTGLYLAQSWNDSASVQFAHARKRIFAWRGPFCSFENKWATQKVHIFLSPKYSIKRLCIAADVIPS